MEAQRPHASNRPDPALDYEAGRVVDHPGVADPGFLSASPPRASAESVVVRTVATAGIVGIGTAIGAILDSADVTGWITGLVVSLVSVILAALLWRSRWL